jgi:MFS family permease
MYTGLLISASQLGKILTSFCWGLWSDRRGRKPVIAAGLLGVSLGSLLFGFSGSFSMALAGRMICGRACIFVSSCF